MNCFSCEKNLSAYIDDELTAEVRRDVETHLDTCDTCRKEYESHMAAWETAGNLRPESAPESLWRTIETELETRGASTTNEDLALLVRGLAEEVRDIKQALEYLRQDMEAAQSDDGDLRSRLNIMTVGSRRQQSGMG
jgi:hypothetical protein